MIDYKILWLIFGLFLISTIVWFKNKYVELKHSTIREKVIDHLHYTLTHVFVGVGAFYIAKDVYHVSVELSLVASVGGAIFADTIILLIQEKFAKKSKGD
jgi:hypothetical protein